MLPPVSNSTHHMVIHINNSKSVGLIVKPYTFRMGYMPSMLPRMQMGDRRGIDRAHWQSFVQSRFDGGAGQLQYSSENGNNKYADAVMVDIGLIGRAQYPPEAPGLQANVPNNVFVSENLDDSVRADLTPAIIPSATTGPKGAASLFTNSAKAWVMEMSFRPLVFHFQAAHYYTNVTAPTSWTNFRSAYFGDKLTGKWATAWTTGQYIIGAAQFSGVAVVCFRDSGMYLYGSTVENVGACLYAPAYSTWSHGAYAYDNRLWRWHRGELFYLQPSALTVAARWMNTNVEFENVGDDIVNVCEFNGKLYIGKRGGLWVFESDRIYRVLDYSGQMAHSNFGLMVVYKGYMYFSIGSIIYRLSSDGMVEQLQTPIEAGIVTSGGVSGEHLMICVTQSQAYTQIYMFNAESGGMWKWIEPSKISRSLHRHVAPSNVLSSHGMYWMLPMLMTGAWAGTVNEYPISAVDVVTPNWLRVGHEVKYAQSGAEMITSMFDMGLPTLKKIFHAIVVTFSLASPYDRIEVNYINEIQGRAVSMVVVGHIGDFPPGNPEVREGDMDEYVGGLPKSGAVNIYDVGTIPSFSDVLWASFPRPVNSLTFRFEGTHDTTWTMQSIRGDGKIDWDAPIATSTVIQKNGYYLVTFDTSGLQWQACMLTQLDEVTVSGNPFGPLVNQPTRAQYWIRLSHLPGSGEQTRSLLDMTKVSGTPQYLNTQSWNQAGVITGLDYTETTKRFLLGDIAAENIMFKFEFFPAPGSVPTLRRFEIEYSHVQSDREQINAVIMAYDRLELPYMLSNGTRAVENSGQYIAASLFSCAGAGIPYVVQVPWPQRHTISARVFIAEPGAVVQEQPLDGTFDASDIPIRLEQV